MSPVCYTKLFLWIFSLQAQAEKMIYDNEKQRIPTFSIFLTNFALKNDN